MQQKLNAADVQMAEQISMNHRKNHSVIIQAVDQLTESRLASQKGTTKASGIVTRVSNKDDFVNSSV